MGFVKLVTIRTMKEPINYLTATGNGYWISKQPTMIPILDVSAPELAYVGEEVEISVYSNCYMTDGRPLVCTYTYNPISDAMITIEKDGVTVKLEKQMKMEYLKQYLAKLENIRLQLLRMDTFQQQLR